ncbi:hypothetical protein TNCV_831221 [Trichonephila clavipes]|nr:hypothetical protein TNCV_831221 [Trichonephila clavipes]
MDVCTCIVPLRHEGTLNSRRAACLLVKLGKGEERWESSDDFQGVLPQNWSGTETNRTVTLSLRAPQFNIHRVTVARVSQVGHYWFKRTKQHVISFCVIALQAEIGPPCLDERSKRSSRFTELFCWSSYGPRRSEWGHRLKEV